MYIWNTIVGTIYVNQSPLEYNDRSKNEEIGVRMESQEVTCKAMAWRGPAVGKEEKIAHILNGQ